MKEEEAEENKRNVERQHNALPPVAPPRGAARVGGSPIHLSCPPVSLTASPASNGPRRRRGDNYNLSFSLFKATNDPLSR